MCLRKRLKQVRHFLTNRPIAVSKARVNVYGFTYLFGIDFNPSNQAACLPIEESNTSLSLNAKQNATSQTFCLETNIKSTSLLNKILEDLDTCGRFSDGIVVAVIL